MNLLARWNSSLESDGGKRAWRPNWHWLAPRAGVVLILPAAITAAILGHQWAQQRPSYPTLGLQVKRRAGQFLVSWDRKAREVLQARRGVLAVRDGAYEDQLELNALQLRSGNLAYTSTGSDIQFRMDVFQDRNRSLSESIRVLTPVEPVRPTTAEVPRVAALKNEPAPQTVVQRAAPAKLVVQTPAVLAAVPKKTPAIPSAAATPKLSVAPKASAPPKTPALPKTAAVANAPVPRTAPHISAPTYRADRLVRQPPPVETSFVGPQITHLVEPVVPSRNLLASEVQIDVQVRIDAEGAVTDAQVTSGSGARDSSLAFAAMRAARQCRFQPARSNGRNVPSAMILRFRFVR